MTSRRTCHAEHIPQRRARDLNNSQLSSPRGVPRDSKSAFTRVFDALWRGNHRKRDHIPEASPTLRAPLQAARAGTVPGRVLAGGGWCRGLQDRRCPPCAVARWRSVFALPMAAATPRSIAPRLPSPTASSSPSSADRLRQIDLAQRRRRADRPSTGRVEIFARRSPGSTARPAIFFRRMPCFRGKTALENVAIGLETLASRRACARARRGRLARVGLASSRRFRTCSRATKGKRVGLVQVLSADPKNPC